MGDYVADDNENSYLPYSLPRLITPAIQCSFCAYFFELYTKEFGWSMPEYGVISWTCTGAQFLSFLAFGGIFCAIELMPGKATSDIGANAVKNMHKLIAAKMIEIAGTFIHWLTYLLLIILPIKWHGVKTPLVDSLFGKTSNFRQAMFGGPVALSSMASHKHWYRFMFALWPFVKLIWIPLYPFMKGFYLCIPMSHRKKNVVNITQIAGTPVDVGDIPDLGAFVDRSMLPLLSTLESITLAKTNNFAMRMNRFGRWIRTRTFRLYLLSAAHGIGVSMHELCNKAIEIYIYPEKRMKNSDSQTAIDPGDGQTKNKDQIDVNGGKRITLLNINLSFFFFAQLLIILLFSLVKFYVHNKEAFTDTFYLISIVFLALQLPIMPIFGFGTIYDFNNTSGEDNTKDLNPVTTTASDAGKEWGKLVCLTIFHGTILFWMFSGGPLTFYVSFFVLGGDTGIMSFGVLIINVALTGTSWLFMGLTNTSAAGFLFKDETKKGITIGCIVAELLYFLLFYKHDWWWNKHNWINYILLVVTGIINSLFVTYTNIMLSSVIKSKEVKDLKWIANGIFYAFTNAIISIGFFFMFKSLGQDRMIYCGCKCFRFPYHYCFPTVYGTITIVYIAIDGIVAGILFGVLK